ncbi:MAG: SsrA-binding protein SmpB [Chloroflexi bacterium]|nr:SsrA-binding protein SmpB [Chloroflexota bacterium]
MARKRRKRRADRTPSPSGQRTVAVNRRARRDYEVLDTLTAGIELRGSEIKSIRNGSVSLAQGFVSVEEGEAFLRDVHIARYKPAAQANHDPDRPRRLLLHRAEIDSLAGHVNAKGRTAIPLRLFLARGWAKLEIGLVRGLRRYDNREKIRAREAQRQIARYVR